MIIGLGLLFKELKIPGRARGHADVISNINFGAFLIPQEILINSGSIHKFCFPFFEYRMNESVVFQKI